MTDVAPSKNVVYDEVELINYEGIRKNYIINGRFDLWNLGTSQTTSGSFSADRWFCSHVAITSKTASQQAFALGQTDVPGEPVWFMRQEVTTASAANEYCILTQRVYGVNILAGKTVTLSFYAKADAVKNISIEFYQNFGTGGSAAVTAIGVDKLGLTTNWARYTVTADITSISGKTVGPLSYLEVVFWFTCGSDRAARTDSLGNQSGTFDIANVALVEGADIAPLVKSISEEQALCSVDDTAYGTSWNGVTNVAPSKNAVHDEFVARPRRNAIINGNMSVWQRGIATLPVTNALNGTPLYVADRFRIYSLISSACTYDVIWESVTPAVGFPFTNALKIDCTAVETVEAGLKLEIDYFVEGYDFVPFEGNTAILSFWVKATKTGIYCVSFRTGSSDKSYISEYTVNSSNTWEKKTVVVTFNSGGSTYYTTGRGLILSWIVFAGSNSFADKDTWVDRSYTATSNQVNGFDSTDNNFSLTGVQLELGSTATEFENRSFAEELALCQRYYEKVKFHISVDASDALHGIYAPLIWVPKRATPTPATLDRGTVNNVYSTDFPLIVALLENSGCVILAAAAAGIVTTTNAIFSLTAEL